MYQSYQRPNPQVIAERTNVKLQSRKMDNLVSGTSVEIMKYTSSSAQGDMDFNKTPTRNLSGVNKKNSDSCGLFVNSFKPKSTNYGEFGGQFVGLKNISTNKTFQGNLINNMITSNKGNKKTNDQGIYSNMIKNGSNEFSNNKRDNNLTPSYP